MLHLIEPERLDLHLTFAQLEELQSDLTNAARYIELAKRTVDKHLHARVSVPAKTPAHDTKTLNKELRAECARLGLGVRVSVKYDRHRDEHIQLWNVAHPDGTKFSYELCELDRLIRKLKKTKIEDFGWQMVPRRDSLAA
jgi:hypothetical protein